MSNAFHTFDLPKFETLTREVREPLDFGGDPFTVLLCEDGYEFIKLPGAWTLEECRTIWKEKNKSYRDGQQAGRQQVRRVLDWVSGRDRL